MSENNYGAMMIKSAVGVSDDINEILSPGIYLIPPANTSSPDSGGGALIIHSGSPIRRTFTSDSVICLTSTRNGNAWTSWRGPLSRKNPFADIKADGAAAIAEALSNLGLDRINQIPTETIIKLGPSGNKQLFINNGAWGGWDADLNKAIPLSVAQGGIGSTTASGGRDNLGLGNSSTRDVGTTNGTVMAGDDSRVSTLKTAAYKDIGTGAGQVPDMSSFVSNKAINGRMELPGGVIRQWGVIQVPGNATTEFSFPVPFPSAAYVVVGSFQVPASGSVNMTPLSRTTFNAQNSYATAQYACWIAEGA
ncbi:hypothetical protein N0P44_001606 [Citrobacter freundii]|nr:hypothetical protein [Citrobacter freundii]